MLRSENSEMGGADWRDSFVEIVETLRQFTGPDLTLKLTQIEGAARGLTAGNYVGFLETTGADRETLAAAAKVKWLASQINVTIHAVGILRCLRISSNQVSGSNTSRLARVAPGGNSTLRRTCGSQSLSSSSGAVVRIPFGKKQYLRPTYY